MKKEYKDRYTTKNFKYLTNCLDLDNLILKCHILSEHLINRYIEAVSGESLDEKLRFTYAQKIEISKILGLFKSNTRLQIKLQLLNKLRNSMAHNLNYDKKVLDSLLQELKKDDLKFDDAPHIIKRNFKPEHLKLMFGMTATLSWIEGATDGTIYALNEIKRKQK